VWCDDREVVVMPEELRELANKFDELVAEVRQLRFTAGCEECTRLGHHPHCDGYIPSIGELLGDY
jgi:hypothetical protein